MPRKILFYLILLSLVYNRLSAQAFDSSLLISKEAVRNFSFTSYLLVDSFSKAGDSVNASACLMRIEPYYLMYLGYLPSDLDTFFAGLKITVRAQKEYRKTFIAISNAPESEAYKKFKEMHGEDQEVRWKLERCKDSFNCAVFEEKMRYTDSVHFDYLYKYVQKHGWPKLSDGSLHAELIALHDGYEGHMKYYLAFMKKAVLTGQASSNGYGNVLNRAIKPTFEELARKFKNKVVFDVSYILSRDTPTIARLELMKKAVKAHKPIKYIYFMYESDNKRDYNWFMSGRDGHARRSDMDNYWIAWELMVHLEDYQRDLLHSNENIFYQFVYSESLLKRKKLLLYLLY